MTKTISFIIVMLILGCATGNFVKPPLEKALRVTHTPNPTNQYSSFAFEDPPYENMWFYRTIVENVSDRDLKIIWFESYVKDCNSWYASNILQRTLRNDNFIKWYGVKDNKSFAEDGWLLPGHKAVCEVNWHYSGTKEAPDFKWSYIVIDRFGNDYYAEEIIESVPKK